MAGPKPFLPVKLVCGIIASRGDAFSRAEERLALFYGPLDSRSPQYPFDFTSYYEKQMGKNLNRMFLSFQKLIEPEKLSMIKLQTNQLEEEIRVDFEVAHRIVNLDPGYMTPASLIMATTKDFSHRIPLKNGIYGHLEFLFGKNEVRVLDWTYPDLKTKGHQDYFLGVRRLYLSQLRKSGLR